MTQLSRSPVERKLESRMERRFRHSDKTSSSFRLAGELFGLKDRESFKNARREVKQKLQKTRPVGVGFGTKDTYGPDESWDTVSSLNNISYQDYYSAPRTY